MRIGILVTSREPSGITGERVLPVPGPQQDAAVRLFVDRATAVHARFRLDEYTLPQVKGICAALDGLPLPIELAAARARHLSVAEIAVRLADRFALLSKGSRTAAGRHRSLRAVVEWSWALLSDAERELARTFTRVRRRSHYRSSDRCLPSLVHCGSSRRVGRQVLCRT